MIGTTVKLKFDGAAVERGIAKIGHSMGRLSRQIAIGGARRVGEGAIGMLGNFAAGIPEAMADVMGYVGTLNDLSASTRESVAELIKLQEAFRLAGADSVDAGRMISTMRKSVAAASRGDESTLEAFQAIGVNPAAIQGQAPSQMFQSILKAIGKVPKDSGADRNMDEIQSRIFGGKMGYKLYGASQDTEGLMKKAEENTRGMVDAIGNSAAGLDALDEALGRGEMTKRAFTLNKMKELGGGDFQGYADKIDSIMTGASKGFVSGLDAVLRTNGTMKSLLEGVESIAEKVTNAKQLIPTFQ